MRTTLQFEIGRTKTDTEVFHVELDDATVDGSAEGPANEPDVTMILKPADFDEVVSGDLGLDVGYMQGRVKVSGNVGRMLSVLPVLTSDELIQELSTRAQALR